MAAITPRVEEETVRVGGTVTTSHGMDVVTLAPDKLLAGVRR